ncbi:carbohydrate kinase family protein [Candidatus Gottesmanbacteria bacterium]|nr:carbohydrate kinase family protein [Candidatus Gottesmanbacteria bacterium]
MFDFVCVGDATRDLFLFLKEKPEFNGGKIPVDDIAWSLGGNGANVSVGLTRLGLKTALVTVFGDDDRGAWIKRELLKNNINLEFSLTKNQQSNLSVVLAAVGERTIFSYHGGELAEIKNIPPARWYYLTSGDFIVPEGKIAFNPGLRDREKDLSVAQKAEVLILNKEEQKKLGIFGPKITAVTDGKNGVIIYENGAKILEKPALDIPVLETTGAGDAFASGFLAALFYDKDLNTALDWGLRNSASVIQKVGAIEGLLNYERLSS